MVKELHTGSDTRKRPRSSEVAEMGEDRTLEQDILKKMGDLAAQLTEAAAYLEKAKRMMLEKMREIETLRRRNAELERKEAQRFSGVPPMGSDGEVASVGAMEDAEEPPYRRTHRNPARGGQLQEAQGAGLPSGRAGARPAKAAARRRLADTGGGGGGGEGADDTGDSEWGCTDEDDQEAWEGPEGPTGGEGRGKGPRSRKRLMKGPRPPPPPPRHGRRRRRWPSAPGGGLGGKEVRREDTGEPLPSRAARGGQLQAQGAGLPSGCAGARPAKAAARRRLADTGGGGGGGGEGADDTGNSEWDGTDEDDQEAWEGPEGPTGGEGRRKGPRSRKRLMKGPRPPPSPPRPGRRRRRRPSAPGGGLGGKEGNSADNESLHPPFPLGSGTASVALYWVQLAKWRAKAQGDPANVEAPTAGGGSESGAGSEGGGVGAKLDGVGDESLAINMLGPFSPEKLPIFIKCGKRQCTEKATFGLPDGSKPEFCERHKKPDMAKFVNEDEQVEDDAQNSSLIIKQEEASEEEENDTLLEPREEEKSNSRVSNKNSNGKSA